MTSYIRLGALLLALGALATAGSSAQAQVLNYRYYQPVPVRTYAYYPATTTYMVPGGAPAPIVTAPVTAAYPTYTSYYAPAPVTYLQPATVVMPRRYVFRPQVQMYVPAGPSVYMPVGPTYVPVQ